MSETPTTQTAALAPAYTCFVCRKTFSNNAPPILGQKPIEKAIQTGSMLMTHFAKEHTQAFQQIALAAQEYMQWLVVLQFQHNDSFINEHGETVRKNIRRITKRVQITDEMIETQVDTHLENSPDVRSAAIALLKTMRATIEEEPVKP